MPLKQLRVRIAPMLATLVSAPFNKAGWVFEEKYDGVRLIAYKNGRRVRLLSRNGKDHTARFPAVALAVGALPDATLVLDGEVVAFDRRRISSFQLLQQGNSAPVYVVFDCVYRDGEDLRDRPLSVRRAAMETVLRASKELMPSHRLSDDGHEAYAYARRRGYEGIIGKDNDSRYVGGRSTSWLKVKVHQEEEFVICGYTKPRGSRRYLGALLLGAYRNDRLLYVGKVGTGFDRNTLKSLWQRLRPLTRARPAFAAPPAEKGVTYVAPRLIAQIAFQEWTADKRLRQPVFLGLRDDKSPKEVQLTGALPADVA